MLKNSINFQNNDLSEDDSIVKMEAELSKLEIKKFWYIQKIQQAKKYISELQQ